MLMTVRRRLSYSSVMASVATLVNRVLSASVEVFTDMEDLSYKHVQERTSGTKIGGAPKGVDAYVRLGNHRNSDRYRRPRAV